MTTKYRMGELTGGEAREVFARKPIILLPMGSHEDQGPHAPMGDYLSAEAMAVRIAEAASTAGTETVVAPVLPFGGADYFGSMIGGIALGQATLKAVISDMLACLLRHDLTRIIVINGHGGNVQAIHDVTQEVFRSRGILIPSFYLWRAGYAVLPEIVGAETAKKAAGHGAEPLTSVAWHLFPELIRKDLIPEPHPVPEVMGLKVSGLASVRFEGFDIQVPLEIEQSAPIGLWGGDPRLCSPETGAKLVARITEIGARFVQHYAQATP